MSGSFAKNDLQLKASCGSWPRCSTWYSAHTCMYSIEHTHVLWKTNMNEREIMGERHASDMRETWERHESDMRVTWERHGSGMRETSERHERGMRETWERHAREAVCIIVISIRLMQWILASDWCKICPAYVNDQWILDDEWIADDVHAMMHAMMHLFYLIASIYILSTYSVTYYVCIIVGFRV